MPNEVKVTQVLYPIGAYFNKDGSLDHVDFSVWNMRVQSKEFNSDVINFVLCDAILSKGEYVGVRSVSCTEFEAHPCYGVFAFENIFSFDRLSAISRLYTTGELISQAFQVIGCFDVRERYCRDVNHPDQEVMLTVTDHTGAIRECSADKLQGLRGRLVTGNIRLDTLTLSKAETCLDIKDVLGGNVTNEKLPIVGDSLVITDTSYFSDPILSVPQLVNNLEVDIQSEYKGIEKVVCPTSCRTVNLTGFIASVQAPQQVCAYTFAPARIVKYSDSMLPSVFLSADAKPVMTLKNIKDIPPDALTNIKGALLSLEIRDCVFGTKQKTSVLTIPAVEDVQILNCLVLPWVNTVKVERGLAGNTKSSTLELVLSNLNNDAIIQIDQDIDRVHLCTDIKNSKKLVIRGKGKIRNLALSTSGDVEIQNYVGILNLINDADDNLIVTGRVDVLNLSEWGSKDDIFGLGIGLCEYHSIEQGCLTLSEGTAYAKNVVVKRNVDDAYDVFTTPVTVTCASNEAYIQCKKIENRPDESVNPVYVNNKAIEVR